MPSPESQDRIDELEAQVAELSAIVKKLAAPAAPATDVLEKTSSRRNMLKLAGAAAAGTAAAVVARPGAAAAADPNDLTLGVQGGAVGVNATAAFTRANYTGAAAGAAFVFQGGTTYQNASATFNGVLNGWSTTASHPHGIYGYSEVPGHGIIGRGDLTAISGVFATYTGNAVGVGAGLRARSTTGPTILLEPVLTTVPTTGTWARGSLVADTAGGLWYCTVGGTPGTWVNLTRVLNPLLTFFPLPPYRAYDSREPLPTQGALAMGTNRTVVIKDQRALAGGAVTTADRVPAGATAITCNITVVNTVSAGFLAANPGGNTTVNAAAINWSESGQILNNGMTLTIGAAARDLTIIAGGSPGSGTDFVIDVTGYFAPASV